MPPKVKPFAAATPVATPPAPSKPAKPSPVCKPAPIRARRLSVLSPRMFVAATTTTGNRETSQSNNTSNSSAGSSKCDVCNAAGSNLDTVRCDECKKNYHFQCLEPPVKKTPKRRGYSWHCADCDPTDVESN